MINECDNKSLLFYSGGWTVGGIEKVTILLANELVRRGWKVVVAFSVLQDPRLLDDLNKDVVVKQITSGRQLRRCVRNYNVGYILNASVRTLFLKFWTLGQSIRLYRYIHNKPDLNGRIVNSCGFRKFIWQWLTRFFLWLDYLLSDGIILLSEHFKGVLEKFLYVKHLKNLYVVTNPISITPSIRNKKKENVILYVGRLEENQKKVSRVFDIWKELHQQLPEYTLEIVGDGPDRQLYETIAKDFPRVVFHGFQDPLSYYENAKCLLMTSDFEGFGLVIVEAKACGCIPIVLNSFESLPDVLEHEVDGFRVDLPFSANAFIEAILALLRDEKRYLEMVRKAEISSQRFTATSSANQIEDVLRG